MCYACDQDRLKSAYGLTDAMIAYKAHIGAMTAGFEPDGVGDVKIPDYTPLAVITTDTVGGDTGTVTTLTVGAPAIVSTIDTIGDQDFYAVTLEAGKTYEFGVYAKVGGPSATPLSDAFVELYDAAGNLIVSADGGATTALNTINSGFDALLTYVVETSGTYYVNARAFDNVAEDGTGGDLVGDYEIFANDVTGQEVYTPYYTPDSPLYALDWGSQVDGTTRNPDGRETGHLTGNPGERPDDKGTGITSKNVITIYFAKAGDVFTPEDPTSPGLPPVLVAVGAQEFERKAVFTALAEFEKVADVVYVETQDRDTANFVFATYQGTPGPGVSLLGSMAPPGETDEGLAQFNSGDYRWNAQDLQQGGFSYVTLIHEFGHGMGMAHPHDNGGRSGIMRGVTADGPVADYTTGDFALNQAVHTMMSYQDGWVESPYGNAPTDVGYGYLGGLMAFDIAVIQDKYGVNEDTGRGDNVYQLKDVNAAGTFYTSIWDVSGRDTIAYDGARDATIDLRAATLQYERGGGGNVSFADGIFGGFTIANGVVIENATTGSGDDSLRGNAANNNLSGGAGDDVLEGGLGNDFLIGGTGIDTASYANGAGPVTVNLATRTAQDTGAAGSDRFSSIENLTGSAFGDTLSGSAGDNTLAGGAGDDTLRGADGDDVLTGGTGWDKLLGGAGADTFAFAAGDTGATRATADLILDFSGAQGDTIDLSAFDASSTVTGDQAFTFIGTGAFTNVAGQLRLSTSGPNQYLSGDLDGNGVADFVVAVRASDVIQVADLVL
jgi:Ca2+-binding RTX toxin-like protein